MSRQYTNVVYMNNGSIGDLLMSLYFLENIHKTHPDTKIFIFVPKNIKFLASLVIGYSYITVVGINKKKIFKHLPFLFRLIFRRNLFVLPQTFGSLPIPTFLFTYLFTGMRGSVLIGFDDGSKASKIFFSIAKNFDYDKLYVENLKLLLNTLDIPIKKESPDFIFNKSDSINISKKYAVVHMFAASPVRSLPPDRWLEIIEYILKNNLEVVLTASPSNLNALDNIYDKLSSKKFVHKMVGLDGQKIASLISKAVFYIGPDTGITHLSALLRQKTIVIGNLSNPTWLPYYSDTAHVLYEEKNCVCSGKKNTKCHEEYKGKKYLRCMLEIPQERIYEEIDSVSKLN